jgi:hypothetical protein
LGPDICAQNLITSRGSGSGGPPDGRQRLSRSQLVASSTSALAGRLNSTATCTGKAITTVIQYFKWVEKINLEFKAIYTIHRSKWNRLKRYEALKRYELDFNALIHSGNECMSLF